MTSRNCGKCLHAVECHTQHNGHFMYCANCSSLCEFAEFRQVHKPTDIEKVMKIGANKQ